MSSASADNSSSTGTTPNPDNHSSMGAKPNAGASDTIVTGLTQSQGGKKLGNALSHFCSIKLGRDSYLLWQNMILPVI
ncbi:hypothetical protein Ddye_011910 [Dipteronia dyeriana]|uniref:Uncharacterized protein n=1 Tax=Dipteronia dyeriana TaxID=168575 RepID=A0AAD9X3B6_9ROSI|nr:hypothetical protein Ddye_011910 [Dipteronia dyeriana]